MIKKYNIHQKYGMLRSRIAIIVEDFKIKTKIPINKRLNLLIKGSNSSHYRIYDLENYNINDYLSEYQRRKTRFINGEASYILGNKLICDQILSRYVKTAKIYSIIRKGKIFCIDEDNTIRDYNSFLTYINKIGAIILKPNIGTDGGRGIMLIRSENNIILCNNKKTSDDELKGILKELDNYIVCEFIKQGQYGDYLYKDTVNTIRILTILEPCTYEPYIVTAVQRIGNLKSIPVDNGGYCSKIDLETGVMGKVREYKNTGKTEWLKGHPETGMVIEGMKVPNWQEIKDKTLSLASKLPYLPYIAWDIVPLDDDILIIEANNCSGISLLQAHEPLLLSEKAKEFYKHYKII